MNAAQRRRVKRQIKADHRKWPLGTPVRVRAGHHSPAAVGLVGKVGKHGYPCRDGVNCIVDFPHPVVDMTFSRKKPTARYGHYVNYTHLRKVSE